MSRKQRAIPWLVGRAAESVVGGGTVSSTERTYTFQVGAEAESQPVTSLSVTGVADHYH